MKYIATVYHEEETRTRIYQQDDGNYMTDYEEYFNELGWHHTSTETNISKEVIEYDYDIKIA